MIDFMRGARKGCCLAGSCGVVLYTVGAMLAPNPFPMTLMLGMIGLTGWGLLTWMTWREQS